jgi:hypothetical protein
VHSTWGVNSNFNSFIIFIFILVGVKRCQTLAGWPPGGLRPVKPFGSCRSGVQRAGASGRTVSAASPGSRRRPAVLLGDSPCRAHPPRRRSREQDRLGDHWPGIGARRRPSTVRGALVAGRRRPVARMPRCCRRSCRSVSTSMTSSPCSGQSSRRLAASAVVDSPADRPSAPRTAWVCAQAGDPAGASLVPRARVPSSGDAAGRLRPSSAVSARTKAGSTWAAKSSPVFALPQLWAFFKWK